ncbi:prepilin-type N-terminal cleavage/methylation domain-containing protein [Candidatus Saccharibacteria bacterium]|nr:prepilin-type N-terminal cleavage/methylation domain-containing protein [Candidatus Saccharibacteria bacterium]
MNKAWALKQNGFTIVELLTVVVIIGILASISLVAYGNVQTRADTSAKVQAMKNWAKVFELYRVTNGAWPNVMTGGNYYCLGTGFPSSSFSGNVPRCRDYHSTTTGYLESDAVALMNLLKTVAPALPDNQKKAVNSAVVGPYVYRSSSTSTITITDVFPPTSTVCPDGTTQEFYDINTARWCRIQLDG